MFTVEQLLSRTRSALEQRTMYWLGAGGIDPRAPRPTTPLAVAQEWERLSAAQRIELAPLAQAMGIDVHNPRLMLDACDCSGYVCWALGTARLVSADTFPGNGGWINTDSIWADALGAQRLFVPIERARPGALLVYPREGSPHDIGHVGIVMEADAAGQVTQVAHCAAANVKVAPFDAIKVTGRTAFGESRNTTLVWYRGIEPGAAPL